MRDPDTYSRLPLTTRVVPSIPLHETPKLARWSLRPQISGSADAAESLAETSALAREEGGRWVRWGAARYGAHRTLTRRQVVAILTAPILVVPLLIFAPYTLLGSVIAAITIAYLVAGAYKVLLLLRGERAARNPSAADPYAIPDADLPIYTVLVPLLREEAIVPVLVEQLLTLDYPIERLEVLLVVEADDVQTLAALGRCTLPPHIHMLVVPPGTPRTKPRALNVGLAYASGEYIVVYDAEDRPERDQLRKAVAAFRTLPRQVVCLQARLNFYNRHQSLLTRLFSIDYAVWYDMLLPGLMHRYAVVPLGGTSNHFRTDALRRMGGWDPFNVTEDADLGVRIARVGLRVMMLDSITWEEAVARVGPWVRQRSRWIKGYIQTYLVHMRQPARLLREIGPASYLDFQLLVGGTSLVLLVNPLMWALTVVYFAAKDTPAGAAIHLLYPPVLYYPALACLLANYVFFYIQLYIVVRCGYDDLARYAVLGPLYWVLMSAGAWAGFISLVRDPHYWAKTEHGISLGVPSHDRHDSLARDGDGDDTACGVYATVAAAKPAYSRQAAAGRAAYTGPGCVLDYSLSVVLPAYNEEAVIASTTRAVVQTLTKWGGAFEVIVVNDGSRDGTGPILEALAEADARVRVLTHPVNRGYGAALVTGFEAARNELVFFMDSDGQFDIAELEGMLLLIPHYDAVLGYRIDRKDTRARRLNAWGWKQLVRLCLGVRVRDVDCAFKLFRSDFFRRHTLESRGAMINAEILYKLRRDGCTTTEIGIHHRERTAGRATGARPTVILRAFKELLVATWRWRAAPRCRKTLQRLAW